MTRLILIRHGNTFEPEDKIVWAGARTDLPLAKKGLQQAEEMADLLMRENARIDKVLAGPLIRTRQHADIIASAIGYGRAVEIDDALREIDYGAWEALSTEEIEALGGSGELAAWDTDATWPKAPGWSPEPSQIQAQVLDLLARLQNDDDTSTAAIITSNGILRFFANALANPPAQMKVRTGHYCLIEHRAGQWSQSGWNLSPEQSRDTA